jgi:flotillin
MVLDALPKLAQPYADALAAIDDITVIDKDGASRVTGQVASGVQELAALLKAQTGVDLLELVRGVGGGDGRTVAVGAPTARAPRDDTSAGA